MAVKKHSHRKWSNYWGSRQSRSVEWKPDQADLHRPGKSVAKRLHRKLP